jgi:ATP adenylyltransferase
VDQQRIWAPWRLGYILGQEEPKTALPQVPPGGDPACFLCQCAADGNDRQRHVVRRGTHTITLLNLYPYNNGHLLVAPRRHVARLDELACDVQTELTHSITRMVNLLETVIHPEGFNIGLNLGRAAGAGVPGHLHWHIVPRWNGDTNFMSTIAGIRVIPQSLEALWDALTNQLRQWERQETCSGQPSQGLSE